MSKNTDYTAWSKSELIQEVRKLNVRKKYGLVWDEEKTREIFEKDAEGKLPVLHEELNKTIINCNDKSAINNILIEGDNYHVLSVLNYTHNSKIDLIIIDPPYNTGKNDFRYKDRWNEGFVSKEDGYRHSKWLNFMSKRLHLARNLLNKNGIILIHIDENEQTNLQILLNEIFHEDNFLGTIIWNKKNPKGDSKGISNQHEFIIVFARNKKTLLENMTLSRPKQNSAIILKKAKQFFSHLNKIEQPEDLRKIIRKYSIQSDEISKYVQKKSLIQINREFKTWIDGKDFSNGEKAYSKIDHYGRVFRIVSMAWPNKKRAPEEYFKPLIHPKTKKSCPVPQRGWRYNARSMSDLLERNLIEFGVDDTVQPGRKYFLDENLTENIPSIINYGGSDDKLLNDLKISFENPKPMEFISRLISYFLKKDGIVLDFMAGSGTTGHAVLKLNQKDHRARQFILCTNNEDDICANTCYPRLKKIIEGYKNLNGEKIDGLGNNLKYFKTSFVSSEPTDQNKKTIVAQSTEMLCLKEGCFELVKECKQFKIFKNHHGVHMGIVYYYDGIDPFKKEVLKLKVKINTYVFSLVDKVDSEDFTSVHRWVSLKPIPSSILNVYRRIYVNVRFKKLSGKTRN